VTWVCADDLYPTLDLVVKGGGQVSGSPRLDNGERWLVEVEDPAGSRIGIVVPAGSPQSQTMLVVRDVEVSSRWYQELLGLQSGHGGADYERLLTAGRLVLQLHRDDVAHHHGRIGGDSERGTDDRGRGVLVWFGDVADFDAVVARAQQLQAPVVLAPHRNPPTGQGNGPGHRELWILDPDGYTVVVASTDGEAFEQPGAPG